MRVGLLKVIFFCDGIVVRLAREVQRVIANSQSEFAMFTQ